MSQNKNRSSHKNDWAGFVVVERIFVLLDKHISSFVSILKSFLLTRGVALSLFNLNIILALKISQEI